jgi:UDP-N-acetylmuramate dehydrogenase
MLICKNISLKQYNTFGLDYKANCMIHAKTEKETASILRREILWKEPLLIIAGGSNLLFTSDFAGTILCPKIRGIRIVKQEGNEIVISAGAGVDWDKLVEWTVDKGFGGLENLSLIPGKVGATPVQNIGAYGAEAKDTIVKVVALDKNDGSRHEFSNSECEFGYRESIFKKKYKGRYLVIRVYFRLSVNPTLKLEYGSLKEEVQKLGGATLKNVRQAVINIRRSKLPDPEIIANAGSFFKNPVVDNSVALDLKKSYPGLPCFDDPSGGTKLAAGWMIEQCGWKGKRIGDAGVHDKQSLVLVNHGKATGKEIFYLSEKIKSSVSEKFGIDLEREVEVIGTI